MINTFLNACGSSGPLLLNSESPGVAGGETRAYDLPFVLIGRDPRCDLRLDHPDVSERHAYLQLIDGQLLCFDLGSRNGVYQEGKRQRIAYMERDRPVRIGPYRIRHIGSDGPTDSHPAFSAERPRLPIPVDVAHRSVRNARCDLPAGLALVGSASDCQIRLVDPSVSSYHCSLVHSENGVWVVDLLGQGGVKVNGQSVGYARLDEGDTLQVGLSTIRLAADPNATAPTCVSEPVTVAPRLETLAILEPANGHEIDIPARSLVNEDASLLTEEIAERLLSPMMSQMGNLRQQLVEEFHQARATMFDTFAALHQEQTAFLHQELEQVRRLGEELQAIRGDLGRQAQLLNERLASPSTPSSPAPSPIPNRLGSVTPTPSRALALTPSDSDTFLADLAREPIPIPTASSHGHTIRIVPSDVTIQPHDEKAHALLCDRIVALKNRQQSYWEKIVSMFPATLQGKTTL